MNLREIDRLVAEKVMGWKIFVSRNVDTGTVSEFYDVGEDLIKVDEWLPTLDMRDAWQVVEKLDVEEFSISKFGEEYHVWVETELGGEGFLIKSKTAPLAICLAALKAVGVEVNIE